MILDSELWHKVAHSLITVLPFPNCKGALNNAQWHFGVYAWITRADHTSISSKFQIPRLKKT